MPNLQTDNALLEALRRSAREKLSSEEIRRQRISYIMGAAVGHESNITRAQVEQVLRAQEGEKHGS